MGSRERVFTILVVEDHPFIASEFEDAVRRNGGHVLGPAARVFRGARVDRRGPMRCGAARRHS